jgi:WD40 repeat protein
MKKANQGGLQQCSFSPNGKWIAATTKKNQVAIWDVTTTELIKLIPMEGGCWGIDFSNDSNWLGVGDVTGKVHVFEAEQFSPSWSCAGNEASIIGLKFGKDASVILAGSENGKICCYDATTHQLGWSANGHSQRIWSVGVSSDGSRVATGSADQKVRLWDVASGNPVLTTATQPDVVYNVEFSSDDKLFINTLGVRIHSVSAGDNP